MRLLPGYWLLLPGMITLQAGCGRPAPARHPSAVRMISRRSRGKVRPGGSSAAVTGHRPGRRVDILGALSPTTTGAFPASIRAGLVKSGYAVRIISADELADGSRFSAAACDLLVLSGSAFPAAAQANLLAYLRAGGKLLCVGGPPFTEELYHTSRGWMPWDGLVAETPGHQTITAIGPAALAQWTLSGTDRSAHLSVSTEPGPHRPALHLSLPHFTDWDYLSLPPFPASPFGAGPAGDTLVVFWAKGDARTRSLVMEWREKDGSRWIASVALTPSWKRYALSPGDFRYWADNPSKGRGGAGDQFHPASANGISMGLARASAPETPGPKNLWIADLRTAPSPAVRVTAPLLEALSPAYKLRNTRPGAWEPIRRFLSAAPADGPGRLRILRTAGGRPLSWMYRPNGGPYAGAAWGASVDAANLSSSIQDMLAAFWVTHAGPAAACFRQGDRVEFTARMVNHGAASRVIRVAVRVREAARSGPMNDPAAIHRAAIHPAAIAAIVPPGSTREIRIHWPGSLTAGDKSYSIQFLGPHGELLDEFSDRFTVLPRSSWPGPFVAVRQGQFALDGKPWSVVGINYFPLSVTGEDPGVFQRDWLRPELYDPDAAETDLALMQRLRINAVSVLYLQPVEALPLEDFLARCRAHGIRANVFLGGGNPLASDTRMLTGLIAAAHLAENDAVFAYDLAWEPHVGPHAARRRLDAEWRQWVLDNYGSIARAERDWGMSAPLEDGQLTNPTDQQLMTDGPWRRMVVAYRRFMDDRISLGYRDVRAAIRAVDGRHLLGARSGWGGNGSLFAEGGMAFDLRAGASHLDFISPEGYALSGDSNAFRTGGGFTTAYARWAGGGKPVFWAEFGQSVYPADTAKLAAEGAYFENICRMVLDSGASGQAGWWWPGGFRVDEGTDFGIVNPDDTPRPAAFAVQRYALQSPTEHTASQAAVPLLIDRDRDSRGYAGVYERGKTAYAAIRDRGEALVIRTAGTGSTTATMPLVAVGDVPADGSNPLKYCGAELKVVHREGPKSESALLTVSAGNTGEAAWTAQGPGRVALEVLSGTQTLRVVSLPAAVDRFGDVSFPPFRIPAAPGSVVTLRLVVLGRAVSPLAFGQKVIIRF